ncbi:MAG: sulfatase [Salinibacter sp.]
MSLSVRPTGGSWSRPLLLVLVLLAGVAAGASTLKAQSEEASPNVVVLFADDMGYGDLSSYGHPTIETPHLDSLAEQGTRFTSFVTGAWCVPSRTQLLTGRYMPRVDFGGGTGANGTGGLPGSERTLAEALGAAGYTTGMAGKWHLGHAEDRFLPPNQGFDSWFGLPYSNDYKKPWVQTDVPLALYRGTEVVEHPVDQNTLTTRYTEEAVSFIEEQAGGDRPFFFYLAYNMPHLPIHTTERFRGQSEAGLYGDVIETIDWSVGQVLAALEAQGAAENTIVFFASDNGPWLNLPARMRQAGNKPWHAGSPGPLRGWKHTSYEGGGRVPAMIRWPGRVEAGVDTDALVASPDIYRTLVEAAGAELPDHPVDGHDLMPFLSGQTEESPRERYYYFLDGGLEAMREGRWKLRVAGDTTQLFDLQNDPAERFNRASGHPERVEAMRAQMKAFADSVGVSVTEE